MRKVVAAALVVLVSAHAASADGFNDFVRGMEAVGGIIRSIPGNQQPQRPEYRPGAPTPYPTTPAPRSPGYAPPYQEQQASPPTRQQAAPASPALPKALVAEYQEGLRVLGYDPGPVDGLEGPQTRAALKGWEEDSGLRARGALTRERLADLRAAVAEARARQPGAATAISATVGPSFDCADAAGPDESAICASPDLAGRDRALSAAFQGALAAAAPEEKSRLVREQRDWLAARRTCAGHEACLAAMIDGRIAVLGALPGGQSGPGGEFAGTVADPGYADFVHLALMADPEAFADQREVAGVAYRLAVTDEQACRQLSLRMSKLSRDVFGAREFVVDSANILDGALASLADRPRTLETRLEREVRLGIYDFEKRGYPVNNTLISGGAQSLWDGVAAPPCDAGLSLHHALPKDAMRIGRMGLGKLSVDVEGAPGTPLVPMAPEDAQAFEAANPERAIRLAARLRVAPPEEAFGPLSGRMLSLEAIDAATGRTIYRWPVGSGDAVALDPSAPDYEPTYADFVHMAIMSDREAFLGQADTAGFDYAMVTTEEKECRKIRERAQAGGEFAARDLAVEAAERFREVVARLDERPRRFELPIEASYTLETYDFERSGFPFRDYQNPEVPIVAPGQVPVGGERPTYCRMAEQEVLGNRGWMGEPNPFSGITAEHEGVPGVDFLPMPADRARAFREAGKSTVTLKARLSVEPRAQGRGPLVGRITALAAHDPETGELLHRYETESETATAEESESVTAWSPDLMAALVAPAVEPSYPEEALRLNANRYFRMHQHAIANGNPPPGSPLPMSEMRGLPPEMIVERNADRLRAALRGDPVALPLVVSAEQRHTTSYGEERGLTLRGFAGHEWLYDPSTPHLEKIELSDRGLPVYESMSFLTDWSRRQDQTFRTSLLHGNVVRPVLELDRVLQVPVLEVTLEEALKRDIVENWGQRDEVVARWRFEITGVRTAGERPVISARILGLTLEWGSDGAALAEIDVDALPTVEGLNTTADDAAPERASAETVEAPPPGLAFDAETIDLFQARLLPETLDDAMLERMMRSRFAYEKRAARNDAEATWGRFFPDVEEEPDEAERQRLLPAFRAWTEARAAALPEVVAVRLELHPAGQVAPFEPWGDGPHGHGCRTERQRSEREGAELATERETMQLRLCDFLDAAWGAPEPVLFLTNLDQRDTGGTGQGLGPRSRCGGDPYCAAMDKTQKRHDLVRLDRIPVPDEAMRAHDGYLDLEIDVRLTGATLPESWPESLWVAALEAAGPFAERHGLAVPRRKAATEPEGPTILFDAEVVGARLVERKTGALVAEPELIAPATLPTDLLETTPSRLGQLDVLGISLGTSFEDAERIIREHMEVGRVLTADRTRQLSTLSGEIRPYTSGRMYVSGDETEMIALFDEPPARPDAVLGIWRILRLPRGTVDPAGLRGQLVQRYGEPSLLEEVSPMGMGSKGVAFVWSDFAPEPGCGTVSQENQPDLWRDEESGDAWFPPFIGRAYYPALGSARGFRSFADQPPDLSQFCPLSLGVRFATYRNADAATGEEIVTWLHDGRAYAKALDEARTGEVTGAGAEGSTAASVKIKF